MMSLAALLLTTDPVAMPQPPIDGDAQKVVELNRAVQAGNDAIVARNDTSRAAYERALGEYDAERQDFERAKAAAAAAQRDFERARAEHEATMARWRADNPKSAAAQDAPVPSSQVASAGPDRAKPKPPRLKCTTGLATGSRLRRVRTCTPSGTFSSDDNLLPR